ncbi:MAG: isocitrate lyase/phosphoenolpyruvate mutase family protein, partial [Phycisphaerales bacterium]|nr:isocitrate lyase/phosphoenolpyruvate mutase family protein [Phycisphaerales bacterium]
MPPSNGTILPAARLRRLLDSAAPLAMPGSFNGLCARAVAQAGFHATYVSGAATSVCAGVPDVGLLTLEHFCRTIREVHGSSGLPLIADADTGFGEAEMVRRTVIEYARAGAAGLHIEDQQFPKRCGHLDGKALVPLDHMVEKVQWAARAAAEVGGANPADRPIICARTDARGVEGFDAAVQRAAEYARAGADMIFPEGLASEPEFADFARRLRAALGEGTRVHLLANMTEFGKTPLIPLQRFGQMGYACVIYPVSLLRVAMGAVTEALGQLKAHGTVEPFIDRMQTRKQLYDLVGYTPGTPWEFPA